MNDENLVEEDNLSRMATKEELSELRVNSEESAEDAGFITMPISLEKLKELVNMCKEERVGIFPHMRLEGPALGIVDGKRLLIININSEIEVLE